VNFLGLGRKNSSQNAHLCRGFGRETCGGLHSPQYG